jgi:hypothetical protein
MPSPASRKRHKVRFRLHWIAELPVPLRRRLHYIISLILMALIVTAFRLLSPPPNFPPLSIHFTGRITRGLHVHPFGELIVTNISGQTLHWSRGEVEAPSDRTLSFSAGFDSNAEYGRLEPYSSTNFEAIVPHTKGIPFRIVIAYNYEPQPLDRLRTNLVKWCPILDRAWPGASRYHTFTSQWFYATADYEVSTNTDFPR